MIDIRELVAIQNTKSEHDSRLGVEHTVQHVICPRIFDVQEEFFHVKVAGKRAPVDECVGIQHIGVSVSVIGIPDKLGVSNIFSKSRRKARIQICQSHQAMSSSFHRIHDGLKKVPGFLVFRVGPNIEIVDRDRCPVSHQLGSCAPKQFCVEGLSGVDVNPNNFQPRKICDLGLFQALW